jgi:formimidoylglutamate deiminase
MSIGSDSHVSRHWTRELQLLEYGQRLHLRRRNVAAAPEQGQPSTGNRLFQAALTAGPAAAHGAADAASTACLRLAGLVACARADLLVLDTTTAGLTGVPVADTLDALVFATDEPAFAEVWVGGRCRLNSAGPVAGRVLKPDFDAAMRGLMSG